VASRVIPIKQRRGPTGATPEALANEKISHRQGTDSPAQDIAPVAEIAGSRDLPVPGPWDGGIPVQCSRRAHRPVRPTISPTGERICELVRQWVLRSEWIEPAPIWPRDDLGWPIPLDSDGQPDPRWVR
jgi:hypothetical protein